MSDDLPGGADSSTAGVSSAEPDVHGEAAAAFAAYDTGETSSDSPPETSSDPSQSPDAAISADGEEADQASTSRGPIPYDRHKAVLTNARNQTRAEVEREYQALAWAKSVDAQRAQQALGLLQSLDALADDPHAALAFIARKLGVTTQSLAQPQQPDPNAMPEADLVGENGIAVYSAPQLQKVLDWQRQQWRKDVDETYGPLKQKAVLADLRQMAQQQTTDVLADCRANWDDFTSIEPQIKALMVADANLSLEHAYIRAHSAFAKQAKAAIVKNAEQDRASQLSRKAAAADSLRPGAPRPVTPRHDNEKTAREIAAEVFASMSS